MPLDILGVCVTIPVQPPCREFQVLSHPACSELFSLEPQLKSTAAAPSRLFSMDIQLTSVVLLGAIPHSPPLLRRPANQPISLCPKTSQQRLNHMHYRSKSHHHNSCTNRALPTQESERHPNQLP